jgi:hypothetical protein
MVTHDNRVTDVISQPDMRHPILEKDEHLQSPMESGGGESIRVSLIDFRYSLAGAGVWSRHGQFVTSVLISTDLLSLTTHASPALCINRIRLVWARFT